GWTGTGPLEDRSSEHASARPAARPSQTMPLPESGRPASSDSATDPLADASHPARVSQFSPTLTSAGPAAPAAVSVPVGLPIQPRTIAGYEIQDVLGRGGMGIVYKAWQPKLRRTVALKTMLAGAYARPHALTRFRIEAEAVARLQHPNIIQIYEIGEQDGQPFFSLEFVDGGSLD